MLLPAVEKLAPICFNRLLIPFLILDFLDTSDNISEFMKSLFNMSYTVRKI